MVLASFIFAVRRGVYAYAFWQAKGEKAVDVGAGGDRTGEIVMENVPAQDTLYIPPFHQSSLRR